MGQVSLAEFSLVVPYAGNCLSILEFSVFCVTLGPIMFLLFIPGVITVVYLREKSSLRRKYRAADPAETSS